VDDFFVMRGLKPAHLNFLEALIGPAKAVPLLQSLLRPEPEDWNPGFPRLRIETWAPGE
jgi:hypothetical protein